MSVKCCVMMLAASPAPTSMKLTLIFSVILYGLPLLILLRPFHHRLWVAAWFFWVIGFGLLHIVYGSLMYFKYDK